ncbi:MAG: hypothetical protein AABW65_00795 [Nanoarchaeota archaeon]
MNKQGHIPTILMFVIALVLCVTSLVSFASYGEVVSVDSKKISNAITKAEFLQDYILKNTEISGRESIISEGELRDNFKKITEKRNIEIEGAGNFFGKVRNDEFEFRREGERYFLIIKGLFVVSENGNNKIKREFDVFMEFDGNGRLLNSA